MSHQSDHRLLVLHALRLAGASEPEVVAGRWRLGEAATVRLLEGLAAAGFVEHRPRGPLAGWTLTPAGRAEHARLVRRELEATGTRAVVAAAYERFRELNPVVLELCSRWQVRQIGGRLVRNDHADPAYDDAVLDELAEVHRHAVPLCDRLSSVLARYGTYRPELDHALARALAGDGDHVARPTLRSYHTVWFELHEDLLVTLGLDRTAEAAS